MKLPRDLGGEELISLLGKYGYLATRQTGSHVRLTSSYIGTEHHVTVPQHKFIKVGTLSSIIDEVADYLKVEKQSLIDEMFRE